MRILITGSREIRGEEAFASIKATLVHIVFQYYGSGVIPEITLVNGGQTSRDVETDELYGCDYYCRKAARELGYTVETHDADWKNLGKAAGPVRNSKMVELGADAGIAFFCEGASNRGTKDCYDKMIAAGISPNKVWIVND